MRASLVVLVFLQLCVGVNLDAPEGCDPPPLLPNGDMIDSLKFFYEHNEKVEHRCEQLYVMEGGPFRTCSNGQWVGDMTCLKRCRLPALPPNVNVNVRDRGRSFAPGEKVKLSCVSRHHLIQGRSEVQCSADGLWSDSFPTCGPPEGCGQPPFLPNGDMTVSLKFRYLHNEKVEYSCERYYVMEGGPFRTCSNGQWVGDMTCLNPCTLDRTLMNQHNIRFRYSRDDKIYSTHDDYIEFWCVSGRSVGGLAMRQKCTDGAITLPTCR